ncbi:MAG: FecR family protein [Sphingobacterium sp.]
MNEKLMTLIRLFWQGTLSKEARKELLSELTDKQQELRRDMEREFGEIQSEQELHQEQDYQLYLREIVEKTRCEYTTVRRIRPNWRKWVVAASFVIISGLGYLAWQERVAVNQLENNVSEPQISSQPTIIRSRGEEARLFTLKDGSEVEIFPGSSIAYDENYGQENRCLQLNGEAEFTVALDSLRPFVVESNGYTTTALGTSFIVDARHIDEVNVKLLSGKVVVKSTPQSVYSIADQYLVPGDELAIQIGQLALKKRSPTVEKSPARIAPPKETPKPETKPDALINLQFIETPLSAVFKRISAAKQIQLDYRDEEVQALYFTGDFSEDDDLETILDIITIMNDLEYEKQPDHSVKIRKGEPLKQNKELTKTN